MPDKMLAMLLEEKGTALQPREVPIPVPGPDQVLLKVFTCAVCRTDLHILDGELNQPKLPLIMGHQIVGDGSGHDVEPQSPGVGAGSGVGGVDGRETR